MPTVHDVIVHCQKQIKKEPPEEKLLHYLSRLDRIRITVEDLVDTGVGRTINQLSRHDGEVGQEARNLVRKWKAMVSEETSDESSSGSSSGEEDIDHKDKSKKEVEVKINPIPNDDKPKTSESRDKHRSKNSDGRSREEKKKHEKDKDKDDRKRKSSEHKSSSKRHSSSPDNKKPKLDESKAHKKASCSPSKSKNKPSIHIADEIDSSSGVKFEELLGCLNGSLKKVSSNKKESREKVTKSSANLSGTSSSSSRGASSKEEKSKSSSRKHKDSEKEKRRQDSEKEKRRQDSEKEKKRQVESIIAPTINISPNYKPSATAALFARPMAPSKQLNTTIEIYDSGNYCEDNNRLSLTNKETEDDALSSMMSNRIQRTKVYSGRHIVHKGTVPRLYDMCMQVIQENIQDLGFTGGVPYDILKPALERASSQQLLQIEECNPYLIGETDELWAFHCKKEFRGRQRAELESWRELFERCMYERNEKFAIVRKKMLKKEEVAVPVRKAKLAYVEPVGGPRFNRQKAATIKNGMRTLKFKEEKGAQKGVGTSASVGFNNPVDGKGIIVEQAVIINPESRAGHAGASLAPRGGGGPREPSTQSKPRRAPLMAKTMKFIKTLQRR